MHSEINELIYTQVLSKNWVTFRSSNGIVIITTMHFQNLFKGIVG